MSKLLNTTQQEIIEKLVENQLQIVKQLYAKLLPIDWSAMTVDNIYEMRQYNESVKTLHRLTKIFAK